MARKKLTNAAVKAIKVPKSGRAEYWDMNLPGFGLRVSDKGRKSWVMMYRMHGRLRRHTLGAYPALSLADARDAARKAAQQLQEGVDPAAQKAARRTAAPPDTFSNIVANFIDRHAKRNNRSWMETKRVFAKYVEPDWGKRPLESINRRDVIDLVDRVSDDHGPYMSNRVLAAVRKLFNWCLERDVITATPVAGIKPPGKEQRRERVLTADELRALWSASQELAYPFGHMFQMLLLTACRRDEIAALRWSWIDEESAVINIPAEYYKTGRGHEIPLSPQATKILESLPRLTGPYVFSSRSGDRPVSGFTNVKKRFDNRSGVKEWRFHDLRRTAATRMAELGFAGVVKHVLGHTDNSVTAIYDRYGRLPEKRHALEAWGRKLETIIEPTESARVLELRQTR
jgi:integrase